MGRRVAFVVGATTVVYALAIVFAIPGWSATTTTTTYFPIFQNLDVSPLSGPSGTVITVARGTISGICALPPDPFVEVTFSASGSSKWIDPVAEATGPDLPLTLTVPTGTAPGAYLVNARCANDETTISYFESVSFTVTAGSVSAVVSIAVTTPAQTGVQPCNGRPGGRIFAGVLTLSRTGPTDTPLAVPYDVSGPVEQAHGIAEFAIGAATADISVTPTVFGQPEIWVTVVDGDDYDVADPSTVTLPVAINPIGCLSTTTAPSPTTTSPSSTTTSLPLTDEVSSVDAQELPHTGTRHSAALAALGLAMLCAGSMLLARRQRRT